MRLLICATFLMLSMSTAQSQQHSLPEFGVGWHVAPSPDPERLKVECGESLRFHGLLEIPYPASCGAFTKTSYLVDQDSALRLKLKRGRVTTDSLDFRYGFAILARGTRVVLFHHLAPGWTGARGWTLHRTVHQADGESKLQEHTVFNLREELIASYPSKFSMPTFFDNPESLELELSSKGLTLRGGWPTVRWYEYVDRSKEIGYNTISLDIPWGQVEREPGVFDFTRFDDLIAYTANRGYYLQLKPWWVRCSYPIWVCPELEQECHPAEGKTWAPQLTFADRELTELISRYSSEIARRYRGYPNVVYTPVCGPSAEMEYSHGQYCDYGPVATARFAEWLAEKYGRIATLNEAWESKRADFAAARAPYLGNKAKRDLPDLDPAYLDFMAFREDMLKKLMTSIHAAMKAADPDCQLGIQVGRTHDGPMLARRGTPGIHYWAQPYEWIISDPQPQKRTDSAGYIVDFIRTGNKTPGVEQTTYESYADDPAVFWEFTWQVWQHAAPLMLIANCAPHSDAEGIHTSRRSAERTGTVARFDRPKTAMFISKWELYAWHGGQRWLDLRHAYNRLTDNSRLVIDVVNGDIINNMPGLLDHYDKIIVPFGDVVDAEEKAALDVHVDKYYSGTATYRKVFGVTESDLSDGTFRLCMDLGRVEVMARVTLNDKACGITWKPPYRVDVSDALTLGQNRLQIEVVNTWVNRMIGDEQLPLDAEWKDWETLLEWPDWFQHGRPSPTGRYTFTTARHYRKDSPPQPSGLLGPVRILSRGWEGSSAATRRSSSCSASPSYP